MKLPNSQNVSISREKLTKYLLSETHSVGSSKAKFFRGLGFDETSLDILKQSLSKVAQTGEVKEIRELSYGTNYAIDGVIETPSGKTVRITTVWFISRAKEGRFIKSGRNMPSFVTAYPV